jgi:asparagine synthase (glutamine-hydrolysing)
MCGICGICFEDPRARVDPSLVEAMAGALAHRGPDGQGTYVAGPIGLGHRRLSIIDLATGDQPIFNEDGSVAIVFNGEIYNYRELRQELMDRGHRLATQSDTEVIVHLYEDLGVDCLHRLNGMFAFALWDARKARLLAARDRLGEKPLYYCHAGGRLVFGSELKALLRDPAVPRDVDLEALDDYLAYGYVPAPRTIFAGVRKLRAGERLVFEGGRLRTEIYWSVHMEPDGRRDAGSYAEQLRALLADSVRLRLRSDVPVGAFLSGGVDSASVVALASAALERPLQTFSVGFAEEDFDELARARLTAARFGTDHHEIVVGPADVPAFGDVVAGLDEPLADASLLPTHLIAREARRFVKVCLSGDAGDELFAGYPHYREARRFALVDRVPLAARAALLGPAAALLPDHIRGKGLLRRLSTAPAERYQRQIGVFDSEERRRLLRPEARAGRGGAWLFEGHFASSGLDPVSLCQLVDQTTWLPEDVLVKVDRAAMLHGLEVRVPFLDHRVVELVNSMPARLKLNGRVSKLVLRRLFENTLPAEVLSAPKRGFGVPLKHWLRGGLDAHARERLLSADSASRRFLVPEAVENLLAAHRRGGRDLSDRVWALLVLEEWCRRFAA